MNVEEYENCSHHDRIGQLDDVFLSHEKRIGDEDLLIVEGTCTECGFDLKIETVLREVTLA